MNEPQNTGTGRIGDVNLLNRGIPDSFNDAELKLKEYKEWAQTIMAAQEL